MAVTRKTMPRYHHVYQTVITIRHLHQTAYFFTEERVFGAHLGAGADGLLKQVLVH